MITIIKNQIFKHSNELNESDLEIIVRTMRIFNKSILKEDPNFENLIESIIVSKITLPEYINPLFEYVAYLCERGEVLKYEKRDTTRELVEHIKKNTENLSIMNLITLTSYNGILFFDDQFESKTLSRLYKEYEYIDVKMIIDVYIEAMPLLMKHNGKF